MPAIGPVRAAVERAPVPGILAPLEPPLDACRTADVAFRQSPEHGDIVPLIDQFQHKGGRRTAVGEKEDMASGLRDGDIQQAPLLGVRMPFGLRENQIEERIIRDLGWKAVSARAHSEHHDVIGLEPFRAVRGHVGELQLGMFSCQTRNILWPRVPVPAQQQDGRCPVITGCVGRDPAQCLP